MKLKCIKDISFETLYAGGDDFNREISFYKGNIYEVTKFGPTDVLKGGIRQLYTTLDRLKEMCGNFEEYFIEIDRE